jgi:transcriptional regulator with XRE-family HTH domain
MPTPPTPLKLERISRGWRLLDGARAIGVSECTLSRVERGELRISPEQRARLIAFYRQGDAQKQAIGQ